MRTSSGKVRKSLIVVCTALIFVAGLVSAENSGEQKLKSERAVPVQNVIAALRGKMSFIEIVDKERTEDWTWIEAKCAQGDVYPLTLNVLVAKKVKPQKVIYMLTSSSLNFNSSFFSPRDSSLAKYLASRGYVVVGITPREDNVPLDADDSVMAAWGMESHVNDIRDVVSLIEDKLRLAYDMLGHSLGAACAMDYAAKYDGLLDRIILLDIPSFDPVAQPEKILYATVANSAYDQLLSQGVYADYAVNTFKGLLLAASVYPDMDSGLCRASVGLPGNFTVNGLLHFSMIYTAWLPGTITELTGLPQEWPMILSYTAGSYDFALDPLQDQFGLFQSDVNTILGASLELGSGAVPLAALKDYTSMIAGLDSYDIDVTQINEEVLWINGEVGMGNQVYAAELMREAGNQDVTVEVVPGYGTLDLLFGVNAASDVWNIICEN
ncbi:hypothetical protein BVX97_02995 [bacterium E08(2017)]|nr:hypothetical protein BVX97_02995 [bacterium E08(2017)]